jgi:hypothetical protein
MYRALASRNRIRPLKRRTPNAERQPNFHRTPIRKHWRGVNATVMSVSTIAAAMERQLRLPRRWLFCAFGSACDRTAE